MKKLPFFFVCLFYYQIVSAQTEWAPVGAKWWVAVQIDFPFQQFYDQYECTGTQVLQGHTCKVIHFKAFDTIERNFYSYQEGDKVYVYNDELSAFVLYFDYSKQSGEHYDMVFGQDTVKFNIDSVGTEVFGDDDFSVQYGHANNPTIQAFDTYNQIYQGIGTYNGLWPSLPTEFTAEIWYYLACYQRPDGKLYNMNPDLNIDCQMLATPVLDLSMEVGRIVVSPNPTNGQITININVLLPQAATWHLHDQLGRELRCVVLEAGQQEAEVNLVGLQPGLYTWSVMSEGRQIDTGKVITIK